MDNSPMRKDNINFITLLRGPAALLVMWDHLGGGFLDPHNLHWFPVTYIRHYVNDPLSVIQDFGFFGVVLFFLISGFVITHVAQRESAFAFIMKRVFRIYPPLIISILLIAAGSSVLIHTEVLSNFGLQFHHSLWQIMVSCTLLNYLSTNQNVVNGVAWTLVIEMIYYLISFVMFRFKRMPKITLILSIGFVLFDIVVCRNFGPTFFLFSASVAYIPFLTMGQILYYLWSKKISKFEFGAFTLVNYIVLIYGIITIHSDFYAQTNSYGVSFVYAYLIFIICVLLNSKVKLNKIVGFYSKISYSLYLNHGFFGVLIITLLYKSVGFSASFVAAVLVSTAVSYGSWRWIEEPSRKLARKILQLIQKANRVPLDREPVSVQ